VNARTRTRNTPAEAAPEAASAGGSALAKVMADVQKVHGGNIMRPATTLSQHRHLPTGIFTLDMALFGGVAESVITQFYGWESSGKTTVAMRVVGAAQRKYPDKTAVFIDAEGTFDLNWARRHGVNVDKLIIVQPETGEQAVDIADAVLRADDTSIVVIDSLPALMPVNELEKSAEDATVALQARLIGRFVRKATQALITERKRGHTPTLLLLNQWRNKIAMMGDNRQLPGGNALRFFVSTNVEILNKEKLGRDQFDVETVEVNEHSFRITKNKLGTGIRTGEFDMIRNPSHPYGAGWIDDAKTVLTYAKKFGVFTGGGSSWRIDGLDEKFGRIQDAIDHLYSDLDYFEALKFRLISLQREHAGMNPDGWL
jgi:recombination protein RecA